MTEKELKKRKEQILKFMKEPEYVPMRKRDIAALFRVPVEAREELSYILELLLQDGSITMDTKGRYHAEDVLILSGEYRGTSREFGFLSPEDGSPDVYIEAGSTLGALNGDVVQAVIFEDTSQKAGKSRLGRVVKIVKRANEIVVGTFFRKKEYGFVVSEDKRLGSDIFIDGKYSMGAVSGHKVAVKITDFGNGKQNPMGKVIEILGHINDPGSDVVTVLRAFGIPETFPVDVMEETESVPEQITEKECVGRLDLRDEVMITIDGEDAKDLDDAVSLKKTENGYLLGVHIADVTEYVREGSALDTEAKKRGTSVYLINKVVPMLPHRLSNGICSLNAGEDRLALSCIMELNEEGTIVGHRLAESVIHVNRRTSYTEVAALLSADEENKEALEAEYGEIYSMLLMMAKVSGLLRQKRKDRGAIDFDFPESKIILDETDKPVEIKPYERNDATRMIEDFMLAANETVAEDFFWQEIPFVYRVHESPDEEKIKRLGILIQNFGYNLRGSKTAPHPKVLQSLLEKADGSPEEALIARLTLRSMKQAKYMTECEGHFGLATKYYCHFTSPIRRYPDLQIHRIIKENLRGELSERRRAHYSVILPEVAQNSSKTERRAEEAERELLKMKKCEYAEEHIGEVAEGIISGITNYGMYVELPNTVEGMIRLSDMVDDYYWFDEENYRLVGERTYQVFQLGQKIEIRINHVDKLLKTIDFLLVSR
ncbi:MAG: ribonuclease R [Lachnospiraceae bacterium]|nr:ribonuclease R [Lachnospiraceae bacterium]